MTAACFLTFAALGALSGLSLWQRWPAFDGGFWVSFWLLVVATAAAFTCLAIRLWFAERWGRLMAVLLGLVIWAWVGLPAGVAGWMMFAGISIDGFTAPERAEHPGGRTVHLSYLRLAARGERSPGPPIVYLAGGPGGSGVLTYFLTKRRPIFELMRAFGDVIVLEQRGTVPWTEPWLVCRQRWDYPSDQPLDRALLARIQGSHVARCARRFAGQGIDVAAFNTLESAADLEALRRHLGSERLVLWGTSYGTHLALAYLARYPSRVARLVLHGVEGPDHTLKLPANTEAALADLAQRARAAGLPDPRLQVQALIDRLSAHPVEVAVAGDEAHRKIVLGPGDLRLFVALRLRSAATRSTLPKVLAEMMGNDYRTLARLAATIRWRRREQLMSLVMDCSSGASAERLALIARQAPQALLGDWINMPFPEVCAALPYRDLGDDFRAPLRADVPALLISGTLDGRTPPANAEEVAATLERAVHLVIDGAGHGDELFVSTPEIADGIRAFMAGEPQMDRVVSVPFRFEPFEGAKSASSAAE